MHRVLSPYLREPILAVIIVVLVGFSLVVLSSLAPDIFPRYFVFLVVGLISFIIFSQTDYEVLNTFSPFLYAISILFLILPLIIGQITRGTVRWIPIGSFAIQPAEIARPFLFLYIAKYFTGKTLNIKNLVRGIVLMIVPAGLILIQPSLGVAIMTLVGFGGVLLSLKYNKRVLIPLVLIGMVSAPVLWQVMAPYQRARVSGFLNPTSDPLGIGYNTIQSTISVGSGKIFGRGLGEGIQTQLFFLPEKQTDFIFASVGEELGFVGAVILLALVGVFLYRIIAILGNTKKYERRAFVAAVFAALFAQSAVHIGMNMGLLPITGLPLPLVSVGGSSFLGTMTLLGMLFSLNSRKS